MTYSFLLLAAIILLPLAAVQAVNASSSSDNRDNWSDENIDALVDCSDQGYDDGQKGPFDHNKFTQCEALSSSIAPELEGESSTYYESFIRGCIDAGNTQEICESAID